MRWKARDDTDHRTRKPSREACVGDNQKEGTVVRGEPVSLEPVFPTTHPGNNEGGRMKTYQVWIDGRFWGIVIAENADDASQQARDKWRDQIKKAKDYHIERQ